MEASSEGHAEIAFEHPRGKEHEPALKLSGVSAELARSPEKIRQLMELLELPEGTNARVTVATSSVIVR
jgi:hypothetical protein